MSALDGFYSTWSKAKDTFGVGVPTDGTRYDGSSQLMRMKGMIESAQPDDRWQGTASQAYAAANKEHAGVYEKLAELDKKMAAEVTNAANVVTNGRNQLNATKSWVESMVASLPATSAQDRERKLVPIANEGVSQVNTTVQNANRDMFTIGTRVTGIKGEYDELTSQLGQGSDPTKSNADEKYPKGQRESDQALVESPGPWTQEKRDAADRLRDYQTMINPDSDPVARECATRRLEDYRMAQYVGPLPVDPVLGNDARARARARLDLQRRLEAGLHGMPPQSPDTATQMLNTAEAMSRDIVKKTLALQLKEAGVSDTGVSQVISNVATVADAAGTGAGQYGKSAAGDMFAGLSRADLDQISKYGGRVSTAANAVQFVMALDARLDGGSNEDFGRSTGSLVGSVLGGMATGAAAGSVAGPFTAAGAAVIGGIVGGIWGGNFGADVGSQFDPPTSAPAR